MMPGSLIDAYAFCFCFAATFLMAGKRPILTLSTRALLVALLAAAFAYVAGERSAWHPIVGVGTLILNLLFIGFAAIDVVDWRRNRARR